MDTFHDKKVEDVVAGMESHAEDGLSSDEAASRLEKYGPNILKASKSKGWLRVLAEQFLSPIVWILIGAGVAAFAFQETLEGIAIAIVIIINAVIGFVMEWQAIRSMDALRKMGRGKVKVIRNGDRIEIDSADLVPGDLVFLEAGDAIAADGRIVEQHSLSIKESALTGESEQVDKHTDPLESEASLADRTNSVFRGTVVTRGNGTVVICATGEDTEIGRISQLTQDAKKEATPLDKRLQALSKKLIWLTLIVCAIMFGTGVAGGEDWVVMIETAIALAVAAIPEGLPVIATMTLARGMIRLAKNDVVVKRLEAVQTLGETNTILTDKTGTLTENEMYLSMLRAGDKEVWLDKIEGNDDDPVYDKSVQQMLRIGYLCNDGSYDPEEGSGTGDPLEVALLRSARSYLELDGEQTKEDSRVNEVPFDSSIKMMATLNKLGTGYEVNVKGAIESVLDQSTHIIGDDGERREINQNDKDKVQQMVDDYSAEGLRVLSFARRETDSEESEDELIKDLTFVGIAGFIDPAREDVKESILRCKDAGIQVVMVTGDHPETAGNIAEKVGIVEDGRQSRKVTGKQLKEGQPEDDVLIYARIAPDQKLELVDFYQKQNRIIGMTGDGVNDAPALKKADIGIAMGQRGTGAAIEAADIVLKDDSFASIVLAVEQGRVIFENIRNFVVFLLSCNLSEIMVVAIASFSGLPLPLLPLQILYLNMVTDVFPALAIGMNNGEPGIMKQPPRDPNESLIPRPQWVAIVAYGLAMTMAVMGIELMGIHRWGLSYAEINNLTFYTLIFTQLWNVFNLPGRDSNIFRNEVTKNPYIWGAIVLCVGLVYVTWLIEPVRNALELVPLETEYFGWIILFSFLPVVLIQLLKRIFRVIR